MTGITRAISGPLVKPEAGSGGGADTPVVVSETATAFGTATNQTIDMVDISSGDTAVLIVMHRDTLTAPTGWTLETSINTDVSQYISVYTRDFDGTEAATLNVVQATSQRMNMCMVGFSQAVTLENETTTTGTGSDVATPQTLQTVTNPVAAHAKMLLITDTYYVNTTRLAFYVPTGWEVHSTMRGTSGHEARMSVCTTTAIASEVLDVITEFTPITNQQYHQLSFRVA